ITNSLSLKHTLAIGFPQTTTQTCFNNSRDKKRKPDLEIPDSVRLETSHCRSMFHKLKASLLRRFQLIEYDDDMVGEDVNYGNKLGPASSVGHLCNGNKHVISLKLVIKKQYDNVNQNKVILSIQLSPVKNFPIPRDKQASFWIRNMPEWVGIFQ
ncbi:unnamed protein product, partial [Vicia faba]